jgi:hypothetical protein
MDADPAGAGPRSGPDLEEEDRMSSGTSSGHEGLVGAYLAAWNETGAEARRALIARAWAEDGRYLDPMLSAEGHAGIAAMVEAVQAKLPGHRFRLAGPVDAHHDRLRFAWELAPEGGAGPPAVRGVDFAVLAPDGRRLASVTGFFDAVNL